MNSIDARTRATIARGWSSSSMNQDEYAAKHGISPRTLRLWISRHASRQPPVEQVRSIVNEAIAQLQGLLDALDGQEELDPACRPEADAREGGPAIESVPLLDDPAIIRAVEETRAALGAQEAAVATSPADAVPTRPRRGSFFASHG